MTETTSSLRFQRRPSPVLPEHRPLYKICQILLVLKLASRGCKSSLPRLHLFNWAFKRSERSERLVEAAKSKELCVTAWGFDPALAIALGYGTAEGLIQAVSGGYQLTDLGAMLADAVMKEAELLGPEKAILTLAGKNITEGMVDTVAKGWEAV